MRTLGERLHGLRWRLTATRRLWSAGATPGMTLPTPEPLNAEIAGRLDGPVANATLKRGLITVRGWAFFPSGPTAHVEVWLGETSLGRARPGMPRRDIRAWLGDPRGAAAGFELNVDISHWPEQDGASQVRAIATSVAGERLELDPVPVEVVEADEPGTAPGERGELRPLAAETPRAPAREGRRVLFFTHQLDLGGAQLYLLELITALVERGAANPTVVSAGDGQIRGRLEALDVPVHICGLLAIDDPSAHLGQLEALTAWAADREFEVVFVNTATPLSFPGAELAAQLGIPAVWSIHESVTPALMWGHMHPAVRRRAEEAMGEAALALFVAEATQRIYEGIAPAERCLTVPYGFDFSSIETARERLDRAATRRRLGIPAEAEVVLCLGTVEPRKQQVPLAQAFERIAAKHPNARLAIVGAREDEYSELLEHCVETSNAKEQIDVIPVTPDVQRWLCVSDLMVCASDIESLPRTVVEAMAWEMPVLATDVFGLPEWIEEGKTGWLCEARDVPSLAAGLGRALSSSREDRRTMGRKARELVLRRHSLPAYVGRIAELLDQAIEGAAASADAGAARG
jgi:D-inositol-3-phosphate glycosyltransferase